jgi:hypothetical protein
MSRKPATIIRAEFEIENGLLGMLRDIDLRLVNIHVKNKIRSGVADEYEHYKVKGVPMSFAYIGLTHDKMIAYIKTCPFEDIGKNVIYDVSRLHSLGCFVGVKNLIGMCLETYQWKDHWLFKKTLKACNMYKLH